MPFEALIEQGAVQSPPQLERRRTVASVLLADSDLASRLTLESLLVAAGYAVEGAATSAEAISRLNSNRYQLVLADLRTESEDAGIALLAYARQKDYRPATALLASDMSELKAAGLAGTSGEDRVIHMSDENVSYLLANVAKLIGTRADRRMRRASAGSA